MIWFTADWHFGHEAMLNKSGRDFKTTEHMERHIIREHNSCVSNSDTIYVIGDISLKSKQLRGYYERIIGKLNGVKHLILGNHDDFNPFVYVEFGFTTVHTALEVVIDGIPLVLIHDPAATLLDRNRTWLVGHVHDLFKVRKNAINVGVDVWNMKPVSWDTIRGMLDSNNLPFKTEASQG